MSQKKKIGAGVILFAGLGVSVWLWSTVGFGEDKGDPTIASQTLTFTCKECKNTFTMTVAEATSMRRANDGNIICPGCEAAGAQKHGVTVSVSGDGGFKSDEPEAAAQPEENQEYTPPKPPKKGPGGAQKKNP